LLSSACRQTISQSFQSTGRTDLSPETFCGAEVRPRQILIKLSGCGEEFDVRELKTKLQTVLRTAIDDTLVTEQVGSGCLFLAESSRKSFAELSLAFSQFLFNSEPAAKSLLKEAGFDNLHIDYVEPNFVIHADDKSSRAAPLIKEPNDDHYRSGDLWGLITRDSSRLDIDAPEAWGFSTGSDATVVGIVDSGIYHDHPDLLKNIWSAPRSFTVELGGRKITCDPGTHGYDATAGVGKECYPADDNGHGTLVAGIIGARGNNTIGVVGVNWNIKLMDLRFLDAGGTGDTRNAINTIEFALQAQEQLKDDLNLRVLNNSWGYVLNSTNCTESDSLRLEVDKARSRGIVFVASAGENGDDNDAKPHLPSGFSLSNVLSVTAFDRFGDLTTIQRVPSNVGKTTVHLAAPGDDIWSTCLPRKGLYCEGSFTSVAAPFVSGTAALMFSIPRCAALGADGIKLKILEGAVKTSAMIDPVSGQNLTVTGGRLNAYNSILACKK